VTDEPRRILIGSFDANTTHLTIPAPVLARANDQFDAERRARELAASKAKLQVMQAAKARRRLKQATRLGFKWGER
jgi:hypothetical protein